jgi:hypothetical protein
LDECLVFDGKLCESVLWELCHTLTFSVVVTFKQL